jgi:AraC-like DNA-binding protein
MIFMGCTSEDFQRLRMSRTLELLLEEGSTLKEIGIEMWYTSLSHFSHAVKKGFGMLPILVLRVPFA